MKAKPRPVESGTSGPKASHRVVAASAPGFAPPKSFRRRLASNVALAAATLAILLVVTEILFRTVLAGRLDAPLANDRPRFYLLPEASANNRDFVYPVQKPPGTFRIVVIGDSFTYGGRCPFDDTFPKRLERMLQLNTQHRPVEVFNWGIPGLSTRMEYSGVHHALKYFQPDLIVLQVTLNDPEIRPLNRHLFSAVPAWLGTVDTYWKSGGFVLHRLWNTYANRRYIRYYFNLFNSPETKNNFTEGATLIMNAAKQANVPVVAAIFPIFSHTVDEKYPFAPLHQYIDNLFTSLGIRHVDLLDAFRGIPADRLSAQPGKDPHPNEIAHRIAAESLYSFLAGEHIIPDDLIAKNQLLRRPLRGRYPVGNPSDNVDDEERALTKSQGLIGEAQMVDD